MTIGEPNLEVLSCILGLFIGNHFISSLLGLKVVLKEFPIQIIHIAPFQVHVTDDFPLHLKSCVVYGPFFVHALESRTATLYWFFHQLRFWVRLRYYFFHKNSKSSLELKSVTFIN